MLNSQPFALADHIAVLVDTKYLSALLSNGSQQALSILEYQDSDHFTFVRTPGETPFSVLQSIPAYEEEYDGAGNLVAIKIEEANGTSTSFFAYRMQDIRQVGAHILNKSSLTDRDIESLIKVFAWANMSGSISKHKLLITADRKLLRSRLWFESHFPGIPLGIATVAEASEVIDLFLKRHREFHIQPHVTCNSGFWYLLSFRSKVPHYHFGVPILQALARRFVYLLMSLDEIGFQYYSGVNNDTMDSMMYYFNYFILLITGIFDSLAIYTNDKLALGFGAAPQKVSLDPNAGKDFLKAVREKAPDLRRHIQKGVCMIKLVYELREKIIHREMLEEMAFTSQGSDGNWRMNTIRVDEAAVHLVRKCGDRPQPSDGITQWGLYQAQPGWYFLEPYRLARSLAGKLIGFVDEYLEMLGFGNFVDELRQKDATSDFIRNLDWFEAGNLGY